MLRFAPVKQPQLGIRISKAFVEEGPEVWRGGYRDPALKASRYWFFRIDTLLNGDQYSVSWQQPEKCEAMNPESYTHALAKLLQDILAKVNITEKT